MKLIYTWVLFIGGSGCFSELHAQGTPIQAGAGYFQTINKDATGNQNEAFYPRVAAPNKISATTYSGAPLSAPYRIHSWVGGAMLWATGAQETDGNGYFVDQNATPGANNTQVWPSPVFQQGPAIADPIILSYSQPPNVPNSNPNSRGIQVTLPYPYLAPDVAYGASCGAYSNQAPLAIFSDPIPMILVYPSNAAPTPGVAAGDSIWMPQAMLVDNMGDYSVTLIYQDPANPYAGTGQGSYIKSTVVQGSPYVFFECMGVQYIPVTNQITSSTAVEGLIVPPVAAANIPTLPTQFQYALLGGIQIDPGQFAESSTLNPINTDPTMTAGQACYTTWAVYFNSNEGSFTTTDMAATAPQNSYFTVNDTTTPFYFVIAALPTIYQYPYTPPPAPETFANAYATQTAQSGFNVVNYAQELGLYAFNFITNTTVSYTVTNQTIVNTTFTPTLTQPYGSTSVANTTNTVMCLMPHHYQNQLFDQNTGLSPTVLPTSANWSVFTPTGTGSLFYWDIRGNMQTILGSSFMTQYIFSNFLPTMPPPAWLDTVTLGGSTYTGAPQYAGQPTTIGQLLFDSLDNEYTNNLVNPNYAPWNTAYMQQDKGIYDVGKTLAKDAKQLGLLLEYIQGYEDNNSNPSSPTYNFFGNGTQPSPTTITFGPSNFYNVTPPFTSLYEQQYNNPFTQTPTRPGAFDQFSGIVPLPTMIQALTTSLQTSVAGSTSPQVLSGVEGAIAPYFAMSPTPCTGGSWQLSHYAYYDTVANLVMLYPSAGTPSFTTPWPGRKGTLPAPAGVSGIFESFGVADAFNDHHYQYGWWISAAALAAIYDGSWPSTPAPNPYPGSKLPWVDSTNYGSAIDQLVKDIAYDPSVTDFYSDVNNMMKFAKMNFFDQWAGHGWADGLQATIAGGNAGHNENSIGEALQAYASIILWGMATQRQDVVNLGIYLYATTSYAMDSYFFDKNLNFVESGSGGSGLFVPTVTTMSNPSYSFGKGFWDYTIHNTMPVTSGTPKMAQGVINYSADFGQTPQNVKVINAFPCNSYSLVFGRNQAYLKAWNEAMDTADFCSTISPTSTTCWNTAFVSNINMLRALGGNATSLGIPGSVCPGSALSPYAGMVQILTSQPSAGNPPFGNPPWGSTGDAYTDPGQSINEVLHFLHILDHYGTPDWNYYGYGSGLVFTAAFTNSGTTTYFAFNPTFSPVTVQFYNVSNNNPVSGTSMTVNPKRWAHVAP